MVNNALWKQYIPEFFQKPNNCTYEHFDTLRTAIWLRDSQKFEQEWIRSLRSLIPTYPNKKGEIDSLILEANVRLAEIDRLNKDIEEKLRHEHPTS